MSAPDEVGAEFQETRSRSVCGLDWASQAPGRAAAQLTACGDTLCLESIGTGVTDAAAIQFCRDRRFAAVGVDVPFGWPVRFSRFVSGWQANGGITGPPESEAFRYRITDRVVRDRLGKHPLSVSSDLISLAARSWVCLVHQAALGGQVDCGLPEPPRLRPPVIEVYPGAALAAICGARPAIRSDGYKKDATARRELLDALVTEFRLDLNGKRDVVIGTGLRCDAFDALVAALTTAIYAGMVTGWSICRPGAGIDLNILRKEGWIYFPTPHPVPCFVEPNTSTSARIRATAAGPQSGATPIPSVSVSKPELSAAGLTAVEVVNRRVLCPACRAFVFQRWPSGWDAHSHRCPGLDASTHSERKAEFKARYRQLFR